MDRISVSVWHLTVSQHNIFLVGHPAMACLTGLHIPHCLNGRSTCSKYLLHMPHWQYVRLVWRGTVWPIFLVGDVTPGEVMLWCTGRWNKPLVSLVPLGVGCAGGGGGGGVVVLVLEYYNYDSKIFPRAKTVLLFMLFVDMTDTVIKDKFIWNLK